MHLFKSGKHVRKWSDFYTPAVRSWRPEFGPEGKHFVSGNSLFFSSWGAAKLRLAGGAQRLVWRVNEPKKTAMRSARARTSGQTPLVVSERLRLRYEQIILLRHFNSLREILFRSVPSFGIGSSTEHGMPRNKHFLPRNNGSCSESIPRNFFGTKFRSKP
jgi:hypothetical protein